MQLKDLAKVSSATKLFNDIIKNGTTNNLAFKHVLEGLNTQEKINIISQSTLNYTQKIGALSSAGLTAEELKQTIQTGALSSSQTKAAASTLGLGDAFTGLRIEMGKALASLKVFLTTNPLGWLTIIGGAIAAVAVGINLYEDSVEKARKKARERTDELFDEFQQQKEQLAGHKKTVAELAARYDELAKGVNLSDNRNVSLSTGEYEEFLNISERLADSFPELSKGIDENGNSILTLGTKGRTAKEQLEDLLRTEEDLNNSYGRID